MSLVSHPPVAVLFVCTANICRSPMAEGILRAELQQRGLHRHVLVDSAGTNASQPGHPTDGRAQKIAAREGINLRKIRARQVSEWDFKDFDYLVAMDRGNRDWLLEFCPRNLRDRITLLGDWAPQGDVGEIPDPYYGSASGFEKTLDLLRRAMQGLVDSLATEVAEA